ncbi:MAG: aldehyde dehydrogenase family protein [Ferruginibacter sp.]
MSSANELTALRNFYSSGATKSYSFRKMQLQLLKNTIQKYEQEIYAALYADLHKSPEECWFTENGFVISEINYALKKLSGWMTRTKVKTNLLNFPSSSYIYPEPLGVVLIISPWNYPFQLLLTPLVGAIAAGNCIVLKASEFASATGKIIKKIIEENFKQEYILFVEGDGAEVVPAMINNFVFDYIFYTGSTTVGKIIYQLAAKDLVPVTLELGGKSPCVVEQDANIKVAAKRIGLAKFSNAGQMCVAPDYILVHASIKDEFVTELKKVLENYFGKETADSNYYGRIINEKQFNRLIGYLPSAEVLYGGKHVRENLFIEPTLVNVSDTENKLMEEEIFGPILPLVSFNNQHEAISIIEKNKNPLAFYVFTSSALKEKEWLSAVAFGGGCRNNASFHLTNHYLPFGGRGFSGTGGYHGKFSFDTFSHQKAWMKTPTWFDPSLKYPPYKGKMGMLKKLMN